MHSVIVMHRVLLKRDHCRPIDALRDDGDGNEDDDDVDGGEDDDKEDVDVDDDNDRCLTSIRTRMLMPILS